MQVKLTLMETFQRDFIEFALEQRVLRFGEFALKSGRNSPYFFNSGLFNTGRGLARLSEFYAAAIQASGLAFDMLYGAAYKGIPLVAAIAIALSEHHDLDYPYCFNRKEAKDHGEKGHTVGAALAGRVLVVDDVISAGTSIRESHAVIASAGARCVGAIISLDRQERGEGAASAVHEVERELTLRVLSIATLDVLVAYLEESTALTAELGRVRAYRARYGTG